MKKFYITILFFTSTFLHSKAQSLEGVYNSYISKNMGGFNISQSAELVISKDENRAFRYKVTNTTIDEYNGSVPRIETTEGTLKVTNTQRYNFLGGTYGERGAYFQLSLNKPTTSIKQLVIFFAPQRGNAMTFAKQASLNDNLSEKAAVKQIFVNIGKQTWMNENLNVDTFRNGDLIPEAKTSEEWLNAINNQKPAWCYFYNKVPLDKKNGKLYNWYAVNDPRGLAPSGYHVASDEEWVELTLYSGGRLYAGNALKSKTSWNGINKNGFSALPSENRGSNGSWSNPLQPGGYWWTSTQGKNNSAMFVWLDNDDGEVYRNYIDFGNGFSIRCIKNKKYDEIYDHVEGLAPVRQNQKWGFIDISGKEVIQCVYDDVYSFENGLALVYLNGKFGYINKYGNKVVAINYDEIDYFYNNLALVKLNNKFGFVDNLGNELIHCLFDAAIPFIEKDITMVKLNDKWALIDSNGNYVTLAKYDNISSFEEGFYLFENNNKFGFLNKKGNEVIPCKYEDARSFDDGLALVQQNGKWGYIDKSGKEIISCIYDYTTGFHDGLALVGINGKYGFINKVGIEVISCKYEDARHFFNGLALVKQNGKWRYIDTSEKEIFICKYDECESFFSEGLAVVRKNGKYGYINTRGIEVVPCKYDYVESEFKEGLAQVVLNDKIGFVNIKGQLVIPCIYDVFKYPIVFENGSAGVSLNGKVIIIDKTGRKLSSENKKWNTASRWSN